MKEIFRYVRYVLAIPFLAFGSIALSGAAQAQESGLPQEILGTTWELVAIHHSEQDVKDTTGVEITLQFTNDGRVGGESTCNFYSAPYQAGAGQALTIGQIISTRRACVDPSLQALENEYYGALGGVTQYRFEGARLRLFFDGGQSVLEFAATSSSPAMPGMPITGQEDFTLLLVGAMLAGLGIVAGLTLRTYAPRYR